MMQKTKAEMAKRASEETGIAVEEAVNLLENIYLSVDYRKLSKKEIYELLLSSIQSNRKTRSKGKENGNDDTVLYSDFIF